MNTFEIVCMVIGAAGTILAGVWFIVNKAQKMAVNDYRLGNMENDAYSLKTDVANLKVDVASLKVDTVNLKQRVSLLQDDMRDVKADISAIKSILMHKFPNAAEEFSMKKSPRVLNEKGKMVFEQIGGEKFLRENKDFLFAKISERNPKTELDVENAAYVACTAFTENDIFNGLKDYVYNAPSLTLTEEDGSTKRYDLTMGDVGFILSIPLRDMFLKEVFNKKEETAN